MGTAAKVVGVVIGLAALTFGALKLVEMKPRHAPGNSSISTGQLSDLCDHLGQVSFADAPPYEGQAPHPIVVVGFNTDGATPDSKVPSAWKPQRSQIQLIGCILGVQTGNQTLGQSCTFNIPTYRQIPIVETTTSVALYEARTGRKVADVSVPSGSGVCPTRFPAADNNPVVEATPDYDDYETAFSDYVNK